MLKYTPLLKNKEIEKKSLPFFERALNLPAFENDDDKITRESSDKFDVAP
jgi:hypothetical protein